MKKLLLALALIIQSPILVLPIHAQDGTEAEMRKWALTPPRGWNSWDCYYSSVNEELVLQNARYQKEHLLDYGWEYVVVDIRWYCDHPSLGGGNYNQQGTQSYVIDEYGRYLPSTTRFPSALQDGENKGFKALADSIHAMGMKFGIHIMRGVPVSVATNPTNYKLLGADDNSTADQRSANWAKVYNGTSSPCTWLKDNALVQNTEEGQLYYNSIADLYAEWGVDFIKVDDMSRPFYTDELTMLRNAIDQCGRPIVLSISPGKTQLQYADQCLLLANQWRMMDDLWDNWSNVKAVFDEAHAWEDITRPGNYADCDMLPLGQIAMTVADNGYASADAGRWTNLTHDEQRTMMTLWGICHSPLFFGGEYTKNDDWTNSLLTNRDMLAMNSWGVDAHEFYNDGCGQIAWTSLDPADGTRYLAMFQSDDDNWVQEANALYKSETVAYTTDGHAVDVDIEWPEGSKTLALVVDDGGDNYNYDHADWINPTLVLSDGSEVAVTGDMLTRQYTDSYFNRIVENYNVENTSSKMTVMGVTYDRGFSCDANAMMLFTIPDSLDVVRFTAMAAADDSGIGQTGSTTSIIFMVFDQDPMPNTSGLISRTGTRSIEMEIDVEGATQLKIVVGDYDGSFSYDRADLINPVLIDADGNETSLTTLSPTSYTSDWGTLHTNENVEGGSLVVDGVRYTTGLGMNAACTLIYDLPEGHSWVTFKALCGYDSSCDTDNTSTSGTTMTFQFSTVKASGYSIDLTELGYTADQTVAIYDIWEQKDSASATGTLFAKVPTHGARLFRLTPERSSGSSISLEATADSLGNAVITATALGVADEMSYVQIEIDGSIVGSIKYDGEPVTYQASGLTDGNHTILARYSGSTLQEGAVSDTLTLDVTTAISSPTVCPENNEAPSESYTLGGVRLSEEPQRGTYIQGGHVKIRK